VRIALEICRFYGLENAIEVAEMMQWLLNGL